MTIQTDNFDLSDLPPSKRVLSAAPASPKKEAIERALRVSEGTQRTLAK